MVSNDLRCPECGIVLKSFQEYCPSCGFDKSQALICLVCNFLNLLSSQFCTSCGSQITKHPKDIGILLKQKAGSRSGLTPVSNENSDAETCDQCGEQTEVIANCSVCDAAACKESCLTSCGNCNNVLCKSCAGDGGMVCSVCDDATCTDCLISKTSTDGRKVCVSCKDPSEQIDPVRGNIVGITSDSSTSESDKPEENGGGAVGDAHPRDRLPDLDEQDLLKGVDLSASGSWLAGTSRRSRKDADDIEDLEGDESDPDLSSLGFSIETIGEVVEVPITASPAPPVAPPVIVAATPVPVVATVTPTAEIVTPLTELSNDRPKKAGFFRYVDGRPGLPSGFDHKTEAMRMSKLYISPLWSAGRENNLEIVIRQRSR